MPFTVKDFPGREFNNFDEYKQAIKTREAVEYNLTQRGVSSGLLRAEVIPAPEDLLTRKIAEMETTLERVTSQIQAIQAKLEIDPPKPNLNNEGLLIGTILHGTSKGRRFTIEVLEDGYLCNDGNIYESLSGAALGVSGNRRSGWKFWKDVHGTSIGEVVGRLDSEGRRNPFYGADGLSALSLD